MAKNSVEDGAENDMRTKFQAISILEQREVLIAQEIKRLEVYSCKFEYLFLENLVIVENKKYFDHEGDEDDGWAVAMLAIESVPSMAKTSNCTGVYKYGI